MRRYIILFVLLFTSTTLWSFEYAGVGLGPSIGLKGEKTTHFMFEGEWQPHKVVGGRFFLGFSDGFWIGVAINVNQNLTKLAHYAYWDINFSLPFVLNIQQNFRTAFIGFTMGSSISFDMDGRKIYFLYISPVELWLVPLVWRMYPSQGWDNTLNIAYMCMVGFRFAI